MKKYDFVVAGHLCLDISPAFAYAQSQSIEELFRPGRLVNMDGVTISSGGPVSNTGFAMARLGLNVCPMANIGTDQFGTLLAQIADKETGGGVRRQPGVSTSYSIVLSPPGIDRIILHDPAGNNVFTADDIDYEEVAQATCFHFGYPPLMKKVYENDGEELTRIFSRAKAVGAVTSLDMSLPDVSSESGRVNWPVALEKVLPYVDLFLPSIEEALFMLDRSEYDRILKLCAGDDFTRYLDFAKIRALGERILQMGSKLAFIKCGAHGVYIKTSDKEEMASIGKPDWSRREIFQPTYHVDNFKSALAGGDTTIAGFLSAMIRGYSFEDCARIACKTGALCCTTLDSISGMRPIEQIYELTLSQTLQNSTALPQGHLRFCDKEKMYTL